MQHCSCLLLDLFTAQKYHIIMVDLNVLSEVGGFKHYYLRVLKHPKRPPKYAPVTITLTHSLPLSLTHLLQLHIIYSNHAFQQNQHHFTLSIPEKLCCIVL